MLLSMAKRRPGQQQQGLTRGQGSKASCPHRVCSVSPQHLFIPLAGVFCAAKVRISTGLCNQCWHCFLFDHCQFGLFHCICWRPYHVECTGSLLTSEVKRHRARLALGRGTAWEDLRVLPASLVKQRKASRAGGERREGGREEEEEEEAEAEAEACPLPLCLCLCLYKL